MWRVNPVAPLPESLRTRPSPSVSRLSRLDIHQLRNLQSVRLEDLGRVNLIYGPNGSGKTSLLEAIHILGSGRSFRNTSPRSLVRHGSDQLTVFALQQVGDRHSSLGVQRTVSGDLQVKLAGVAQRNLSQLAFALPVQVIDASTFDLLVGSPAVRRQFLNWGVFHVEHGFHEHWMGFQRALKQRNTLLRRGTISGYELAVWDRKVAEAGEAIHAFRLAYFEALAPRFRQVLNRLVPELDQVEVRYRRGWDRKVPYAEALAVAGEGDRERGFTQTGPHRADVRITVQGRSAAETLSRGQQKLLVIALKLAQGGLLREATGRQCLYLVDDLPAELDRGHLGRVCEELDALGAQVFLTSVDRDDLQVVWPTPEALKLFHVEHGQVRASAPDGLRQPML
ncbi:DNA replication/repair protein RecF [Haliea atlantica]